MKSIIQTDKTYCYICKQTGNRLEEHHIFHGNGIRRKSEKYGLKCYLCANKCHKYGEFAVHNNIEYDLKLKQHAQKKAMKYYKWTTDDFIKIIGKNYI